MAWSVAPALVSPAYAPIRTIRQRTTISTLPVLTIRWISAQTIIQERAPVSLRGRVFATQLVLSNAISIVPLLFLGGLADVIGVAQTLFLLGLGILATAVLTVRAHRSLASESALPLTESAPPG